MKEWLLTQYAADDGGDGGAAPAPEQPPTETAEPAPFSPEQQAQVDKIVKDAIAKERKKAEKAAAEQAMTEAEKIAKERADLEAERAQLHATTALVTAGLTLSGNGSDADNDLLARMVAGEDCAARIALLQKIIESKTTAAVDKRLTESTRRVPIAGGGATSDIGAAINAQLRAHAKSIR